MTPELLLLCFILALCACLISGFPVAFVLAGVSLWVAIIGDLLGLFNLSYIAAFPDRIYGIMTNDLLQAVPLFVFMGVMLERSKVAESLLTTMADVMGGMRAGISLSVMLVGAMLAASTGIVGATVVTMGLISLPVMLQRECCPRNACGTIAAAGTLGQIIPPSIVLILLSDQISGANQIAQLTLGNLSPEPVSIADVFMGALIPGLLLVGLYMGWILFYNLRHQPTTMPSEAPPFPPLAVLLKVLLPPLTLIIIVLGSILAGLATATESAAIGAIGAMGLAGLHKKFTLDNLRYVCRETLKTTCMVFAILIGAALFSLVFRGLGGDDLVHQFLHDLPGGMFGALFIVMALIFLLGFFLDFIEIIYVVVPIIAPILITMGADPVWLAIMLAINLQTSFLTPPFGFALFYLRGVAPDTIQTMDIYRGAIPFVGIQLLMLGVLVTLPQLATWLPDYLYGAPAASVTAPTLSPAPSYGVDF